MCDADEGCWGEHDFSLNAIVLRCRNGPLAEGYLDAYLDHQRVQHAAVQRGIETMMSKATSSAAWTFD